MLKKNIDLRVEILSYLNEDNKLEYYPSCGFPLEVFVVNEYAAAHIFTKENLNHSNFVFFISVLFNADLAITLKKLVFVGSYLLHDQFSYNSIVADTNRIFTTAICSSFTVVTLFASQYLDTKIIQIQKSNQNRLFSISKIFSNASWLERENSEMFDLIFINLVDSRKLLLDYTCGRGLMLKTNYKVYNSNYYKNYFSVNCI